MTVLEKWSRVNVLTRRASVVLLVLLLVLKTTRSEDVAHTKVVSETVQGFPGAKRSLAAKTTISAGLPQHYGASGVPCEGDACSDTEEEGHILFSALQAAVLLRDNMAAVFGLFLHHPDNQLEEELYSSLKILHDLVRLRRIQTTRLVSVLPAISEAAPRAQFLIIFRQLAYIVPEYARSAVDVWIAELQKGHVELGDIMKTRDGALIVDFLAGFDRGTINLLNSYVTIKLDHTDEPEFTFLTSGDTLGAVMGSLRDRKIRLSQPLFALILAYRPRNKMVPDKEETERFLSQILVQNGIEEWSQIVTKLIQTDFKSPVELIKTVLELIATMATSNFQLSRAARELVDYVEEPKENFMNANFDSLSPIMSKPSIDVLKLLELIVPGQYPDEVIDLKNKIKYYIRSGFLVTEVATVGFSRFDHSNPIDLLIAILSRVQLNLPNLPHEIISAVNHVKLYLCHKTIIMDMSPISNSYIESMLLTYDSYRVPDEVVDISRKLFMQLQKDNIDWTRVTSSIKRDRCGTPRQCVRSILLEANEQKLLEDYASKPLVLKLLSRLDEDGNPVGLWKKPDSPYTCEYESARRGYLNTKMKRKKQETSCDGSNCDGDSYHSTDSAKTENKDGRENNPDTKDNSYKDEKWYYESENSESSKSQYPGNELKFVTQSEYNTLQNNVNELKIKKFKYTANSYSKVSYDHEGAYTPERARHAKGDHVNINTMNRGKPNNYSRKPYYKTDLYEDVEYTSENPMSPREDIANINMLKQKTTKYAAKSYSNAGSNERGESTTETTIYPSDDANINILKRRKYKSRPKNYDNMKKKGRFSHREFSSDSVHPLRDTHPIHRVKRSLKDESEYTKKPSTSRKKSIQKLTPGYLTTYRRKVSTHTHTGSHGQQRSTTVQTRSQAEERTLRTEMSTPSSVSASYKRNGYPIGGGRSTSTLMTMSKKTVKTGYTNTTTYEHYRDPKTSKIARYESTAGYSLKEPGYEYSAHTWPQQPQTSTFYVESRKSKPKTYISGRNKTDNRPIYVSLLHGGHAADEDLLPLHKMRRDLKDTLRHTIEKTLISRKTTQTQSKYTPKMTSTPVSSKPEYASNTISTTPKIIREAKSKYVSKPITTPKSTTEDKSKYQSKTISATPKIIREAKSKYVSTQITTPITTTEAKSKYASKTKTTKMSTMDTPTSLKSSTDDRTTYASPTTTTPKSTMETTASKSTSKTESKYISERLSRKSFMPGKSMVNAKEMRKSKKRYQPLPDVPTAEIPNPSYIYASNPFYYAAYPQYSRYLQGRPLIGDDVRPVNRMKRGTQNKSEFGIESSSTSESFTDTLLKGYVSTLKQKLMSQHESGRTQNQHNWPVKINIDSAKTTFSTTKTVPSISPSIYANKTYSSHEKVIFSQFPMRSFQTVTNNFSQVIGNVTNNFTVESRLYNAKERNRPFYTSLLNETSIEDDDFLPIHRMKRNDFDESEYTKESTTTSTPKPTTTIKSTSGSTTPKPSTEAKSTYTTEAATTKVTTTTTPKSTKPTTPKTTSKVDSEYSRKAKTTPKRTTKAKSHHTTKTTTTRKRTIKVKSKHSRKTTKKTSEYTSTSKRKASSKSKTRPSKGKTSATESSSMTSSTEKKSTSYQSGTTKSITSRGTTTVKEATSTYETETSASSSISASETTTKSSYSGDTSTNKSTRGSTSTSYSVKDGTTSASTITSTPSSTTYPTLLTIPFNITAPVQLSDTYEVYTEAPVTNRNIKVEKKGRYKIVTNEWSEKVKTHKRHHVHGVRPKGQFVTPHPKHFEKTDAHSHTDYIEKTGDHVHSTSKPVIVFETPVQYIEGHRPVKYRIVKYKRLKHYNQKRARHHTVKKKPKAVYLPPPVRQRYETIFAPMRNQIRLQKAVPRIIIPSRFESINHHYVPGRLSRRMDNKYLSPRIASEEEKKKISSKSKKTGKTSDIGKGLRKQDVDVYDGIYDKYRSGETGSEEQDEELEGLVYNFHEHDHSSEDSETEGDQSAPKPRYFSEDDSSGEYSFSHDPKLFMRHDSSEDENESSEYDNSYNNHHGDGKRDKYVEEYYIETCDTESEECDSEEYNPSSSEDESDEDNEIYFRSYLKNPRVKGGEVFIPISKVRQIIQRAMRSSPFQPIRNSSKDLERQLHSLIRNLEKEMRHQEKLKHYSSSSEGLYETSEEKSYESSGKEQPERGIMKEYTRIKNEMKGLHNALKTGDRNKEDSHEYDEDSMNSLEREYTRTLDELSSSEERFLHYAKDFDDFESYNMDDDEYSHNARTNAQDESGQEDNEYDYGDEGPRYESYGYPSRTDESCDEDEDCGSVYTDDEHSVGEDCDDVTDPECDEDSDEAYESTSYDTKSPEKENDIGNDGEYPLHIRKKLSTRDDSITRQMKKRVSSAWKPEIYSLCNDQYRDKVVCSKATPSPDVVYSESKQHLWKGKWIYPIDLLRAYLLGNKKTALQLLSKAKSLKLKKSPQSLKINEAVAAEILLQALGLHYKKMSGDEEEKPRLKLKYLSKIYANRDSGSRALTQTQESENQGTAKSYVEVKGTKIDFSQFDLQAVHNSLAPSSFSQLPIPDEVSEYQPANIKHPDTLLPFTVPGTLADIKMRPLRLLLGLPNIYALLDGYSPSSWDRRGPLLREVLRRVIRSSATAARDPLVRAAANDLLRGWEAQKKRRKGAEQIDVDSLQDALPPHYEEDFDGEAVEKVRKVLFEEKPELLQIALEGIDVPLDMTKGRLLEKILKRLQNLKELQGDEQLLHDLKDVSQLVLRDGLGAQSIPRLLPTTSSDSIVNARSLTRQNLSPQRRYLADGSASTGRQESSRDSNKKRSRESTAIGPIVRRGGAVRGGFVSASRVQLAVYKGLEGLDGRSEVEERSEELNEW